MRGSVAEPAAGRFRKPVHRLTHDGDAKRAAQHVVLVRPLRLVAVGQDPDVVPVRPVVLPGQLGQALALAPGMGQVIKLQQDEAGEGLGCGGTGARRMDGFQDVAHGGGGLVAACTQGGGSVRGQGRPAEGQDVPAPTRSCTQGRSTLSAREKAPAHPTTTQAPECPRTMMRPRNMASILRGRAGAPSSGDFR